MKCFLLALVLSIALCRLGGAQPTAMTSLATPEQTRAFVAAQGNPTFLVFTAPRETPIQRLDALPVAWLTRTPDERSRFTGSAAPGEFFVFQVALYNATDQAARVVSAQLTLGDATTHCLNFEARPADELPRREGLPLGAGRLKPLWFGVTAATAGKLAGTAEIVVHAPTAGKFTRLSVPVTLTVAGEPVRDSGTDQPEKLTRLSWLLPSALGTAPQPTKGYAPVVRKGRTLTLTATRLTLDTTGLPAQIEGLLDGSNVRRAPAPTKLLAAPARLVVETESGPLALHPEPLRFTETTAEKAAWSTRWVGDGVTVTVEGSLAFDGYLTYQLRLATTRAIAVRDIRLELPYRPTAARFAMGLGLRGGTRPERWDWRWNLANHQDRLWVGDVAVGAQWQLVGANYRRPLVNIYYGFQPLALPESWGNDGKGGVTLRTEKDHVLVTAFSGPRTLNPTAPLVFGLRGQLTPARPLDTEKQWAVRFSHGDADAMLRDAESDGATVLNVHHGQQINPFINYPFHPLASDDMAAYVRQAHAKNRRVKVYYTTRELTKALPEFWALRALDGAVIQPGPGPKTRTILHGNGPHPWLVENVREDFIPAWQTDLGGKYAGQSDISVLTRPDGSWNEFYLHGLDYLCRKAEIDGVYIDDTALDRASLLRARRILEARRPDPLIDFHSWNPFDDLDSRIVSASLYLELFPFVDRIWLGEAADYNQSPESWLVQYAGIPYGVMGEMLEGGGNPWRGMLFGMTCRLRWSGDPRPLWKFWDGFGMAGTQLSGWWDSACPVRTDNAAVKATVYAKPGAKKALIAVASWAKTPTAVHLIFDTKVLGFTPKRLRAEPIDKFQPAATFAPTDAIALDPAHGWLLIAE